MAVEAVAPAIEHVARLYRLREPDEVRALLAKSPQLLDLLERTYPEIRRIFGEHLIAVFLEPRYDLEDGDESVWIKIQLDLNVEASRQYLDQFDREWWLDAYQPFFGQIQAMTECGPLVRP